MAYRAIAEGLGAYPFDASLDPQAQRGLDRLRCIADRALAENLYVLFQVAERNTVNAAHSADSRKPEELRRLRLLAARAIKGELGPEPEELAENLLLDEQGSTLDDERSLRDFAFALAKLRRISR